MANQALTITRQAILQEARSWIGTRFQHQGRVKADRQHKGGCDCIGLIVGVLSALDIPVISRSRPDVTLTMQQVDRSGYSRIPEGNALYYALSAYLEEIPHAEMQPADIALFRIECYPQHVAFISNYEGKTGVYGLVHAYAQARKVCEHRMDHLWHTRLVSVFRIPRVAIEIQGDKINADK